MLTALLGCVIGVVAAGAPAAAAVDEPLRATLLQMGRDDQEAIRIGTADASRPATPTESMVMDDIHRKNGELIRAIVEEHGWPARSLVGDDGAHAAWLVVQHMDEDVAFQRSCLALMQQAFLIGEVGPQEYAYLTDRVLTHEGRKQMYGTQGGGVTSAEDEARVDANRTAIGLPPWRIAVERRQKEYANGYGGSAAKTP